MKKRKPSRVYFQVLSCLGYEVFLKYKKSPCTLLLYIVTSITCAYDEQTHCVWVWVSVYLWERVLFVGTVFRSHSI